MSPTSALQWWHISVENRDIYMSLFISYLCDLFCTLSPNKIVQLDKNIFYVETETFLKVFSKCHGSYKSKD